MKVGKDGPRMKSNSSVFEGRGDPWVSDREGERDFGRRIGREDNDFDKYFAKTAPVKTEPPSEVRKEKDVVASVSRKLRVRVHMMNKELRGK